MNSERIGVELSRIARRFPTSRQYGQLPTVILRLFAHSAAMLPRLRLPRTWSFVCSLALENVRQEKTAARVSSDSYSRNLPEKFAKSFPGKRKREGERKVSHRNTFSNVYRTIISLRMDHSKIISAIMCSF